MPIRPQVRRDLHKHIDDKLYKWVKDSCQLYNMADLDSSDCTTDMMISLFTAVGALSAAFELDHDQLVRGFRKTLEITKRKHDETESRS